MSDQTKDAVQNTGDSLLALERERIKLERLRLAIELANYNLRRRAYRQSTRSLLDRIDDALFG